MTTAAVPELIGHSPAIRRLVETIRQIADSRATVLITGESGTGKELVARALHGHSARRDRPFVAVNCAAIPDELVESELFGHERGAFTDAYAARAGRFEQAHGGTLLLDEIGELSPHAQAKLLRVLQDMECTRVGGTHSIRVDTRVIASTNMDLRAAIRDGRFREDLFYRLNVVGLVVPPLRERPEDIPLLLHHFIARYAGSAPRAPRLIAPDVLDCLTQYDWPGNVREMEHVIERMITLSDAPIVHVRDLPVSLRTRAHAKGLAQRVRTGQMSFTDAVNAFELELITDALERANHVQTRTARLLGITRRILKYKMDALGIPVKRPRARPRRREAA